MNHLDKDVILAGGKSMWYHVASVKVVLPCVIKPLLFAYGHWI